MLDSIEALSWQLQEILSNEETVARQITKIQEVLAELPTNLTWLYRFIEDKLLSQEFIIEQLDTIWPNEITLYRSPKREFTVLGYVWEPWTRDVVHDHGAWGVISSVNTKVSERKYHRLDDGEKEGTALLEEIEFAELSAGESTVVQALDGGIHRMENNSDEYVFSVNVYGHSLGRGYVRFFDPERNRTWRAYRAVNNKPVAVLRALAGNPDPLFGSLLARIQEKDLPKAIKDEAHLIQHYVR